MKIIITISFVLFSVLSFSQETICINKDSIYNDLKERRHSDSLWITKELVKLKASYSKEPHNDSLIYDIGKFYYRDFLMPYKRPSRFWYIYQTERNIYDSISFVMKEKYFKKSFFENSADSALCYFKKIEKTFSEQGKVSFFAIKQLECYVNSDSSFVDLSIYVSPSDYIPYWYLANLDENWRCDFSKDYLDILVTSLIVTPDKESSLTYLDEKPLFLKNIPIHTEIFRMTYSPSFHDDICIRVECVNEKVNLYWKINKKNKGYTEGISKEGVKELSQETWNYFLQLLEEFNFVNLPNASNSLIFCDGASWFLEYKTNDLYKAVYHRIPSRDIEVLSLYLLELSGVSYKTEKWNTRYSGYFRYDLNLTEDMKYVVTKDIEDTLITCLNQYVNRTIDENKCCCYFDSYLKFSKTGKVKKVKYPEDENWFFDLWWGFQNRKCRKEIKQALKNIDLSYLNLSKPLYYYLEIDYDKEKHLFIKEK